MYHTKLCWHTIPTALISQVTDYKKNWNQKVPSGVNNMQETNGEHVYTEAPHKGRKPQSSDQIDASESEPAWACLKLLKSTNSLLFRNTAKMKDLQQQWSKFKRVKLLHHFQKR